MFPAPVLKSLSVSSFSHLRPQTLWSSKMSLLYVSKFLAQRIWKLILCCYICITSSYTAVGNASFPEITSRYIEREINLASWCQRGRAVFSVWRSLPVLLSGMISLFHLVVLFLAGISGYNLWRFFVCLWPHPQHTEVLVPRIESETQLWPMP